MVSALDSKTKNIGFEICQKFICVCSLSKRKLTTPLSISIFIICLDSLTNYVWLVAKLITCIFRWSPVCWDRGASWGDRSRGRQSHPSMSSWLQPSSRIQMDEEWWCLWGERERGIVIKNVTDDELMIVILDGGHGTSAQFQPDTSHWG